jgi:hypothetical protein
MESFVALFGEYALDLADYAELSNRNVAFACYGDAGQS